jgi:hypothetical protein
MIANLNNSEDFRLAKLPANNLISQSFKEHSRISRKARRFRVLCLCSGWKYTHIRSLEIAESHRQGDINFLRHLKEAVSICRNR